MKSQPAIVELPLLVQRWLDVGEAWVFHPSLVNEIEQRISELRAYANEHLIEGCLDKAPWQTLFQTADGHLVALSIERDIHTPDERARLRNATIWRAALLPVEASEWQSQDTIAAIYARMNSFWPQRPGADSDAVLNQIEIAVEPPTTTPRNFTTKWRIAVMFTSFLLCIFSIAWMIADGGEDDRSQGSMGVLRWMNGLGKPEKFPAPTYQELLDLHRNLDQFFMADVEKSQCTTEVAVVRLHRLHEQFFGTPAPNDNVWLLWREAGIQQQVKWRLEHRATSDFEEGRKGDMTGFVAPDRPRREWMRSVRRLKDVRVAIKKLTTGDAHSELGFSKHDPVASMMSKISTYFPLNGPASERPRSMIETNDAVCLAFPTDQDRVALKSISNLVKDHVGRGGSEGLLEEVKYFRERAEHRQARQVLPLYDAFIELIILEDQIEKMP